MKQNSRNKPNASNKIQNPTIKKKKVRILFDFDKIVLTKNDAFVGKSYCNKGLFMLNVYDIINNNASSSFFCFSFSVYASCCFFDHADRFFARPLRTACLTPTDRRGIRRKKSADLNGKYFIFQPNFY